MARRQDREIEYIAAQVQGSTSRRRMAYQAEEVDAYGRWRKVIISMGRAGKVKAIKRRTHKRERREGKKEIKSYE